MYKINYKENKKLMATSSNSKVFVSPGVYTSEVDLSFVAQSVGVTTLGIVGETERGPAFEPIFITNYDEFSTYFGGTNPEKFINTQIPKYEASYIAKSYLQQSNQLFVTRILGLSGYDAGPSWSITTKANVDPTTVGFVCQSSTTVDCVSTCVDYETYDYSIQFTGCTDSIDTITLFNTSNLTQYIGDILGVQYELFNGSTNTLMNNLESLIYTSILTPSSSANTISYFGVISGDTYETVLAPVYTNENNVFGIDTVDSNVANLSDSNNDPWYYCLFENIGGGQYTGTSFYGVVSALNNTSCLSTCATFLNFSVSGTPGSINYNTNTIVVVVPQVSGVCPSLSAVTVDFLTCSGASVSISGTPVSSGDSVDFTTSPVVFSITSETGNVISNWNVYVTCQNPCNQVVTGNTGTAITGTTVCCYSGSVSGTVYVYSGTPYTSYDDMVIATLRSRGIATYGNDNGAVYEVSGLTDVSMVCTGAYSGVSKNPYSTFGLNITNKDGDAYFFETSFSIGDSKFISKVFGTDNFGKPRIVVPLFVEEQYLNLLTYAYRKGYIRGLNCQLVALPDARSQSTESIAWYLEKYTSAESPWVVSELRGNKVFNLFKFITIGDGDSANVEVKISLANMSFGNGTFDVLVRDFFDTDANPVVLEKFTNCSMNPNENSFIAKKIGSSNGEYTLLSKFIMVEMNEDAPIDALPCGFLGYNIREYDGATPPFPIYKTKYDYPGEVIYNPPFGTSLGTDDAVTSPGDNVRRTFLGISNSPNSGYDVDFFLYKGKQNIVNICTDVEAPEWNYRTRGFHMDINASAITIPNVYATSGTPAFFVGDAPFVNDPENPENPYYRIYARKFSLLCYGGFDGWDIYREYRTNKDQFLIGRTGYLKGACPTFQYPNATGWGAFKQITVGDNTQTFANTDYYAYLLGIYTFNNPEAININVFVTPGIDYVNNSNLVEAAVEMIEFNRADSLYIVTTPDYDMYAPSTVGNLGFIYPQEAVDNLANSGLDSNYTATYYPWVLTRDTVNNTQVYIPATAEVTRNLALTDNIAFPWFASAGYTRGLVNAIKARKKLTQQDRDTLYQGRINPIATFSDVNTVIWGNKTLQVRESALDRINVRRLLLQARKLISAVSVRLLFEQNDAVVRQQFLDSVNPILDAIRRDRGLYDFRVTVSSDAADLDRNQMTGKIYIKPTRSLEFIDITFYITPTGASFENI